MIAEILAIRNTVLICSDFFPAILSPPGYN